MTTMPVTMLARERIGDPRSGHAVVAMVRRRVPANDVDDVTQTVLCAALTAPKLPAEPSELRRFLCVLARNKVADFHRRSRRRDVAVAECEITSPPPPVEARSLLERVVSAVSPRDRETLSWLVREHEGEPLAEIAEDVGLPAPTVRQRVSRLRRALRAQWAHALLVVLAAGAAGAALREIAHRPSEAITADPAADPGARVLGVAQGRWHLDDASSIEQATAGRIDPRIVELSISGRRVDVRAPFGVASRTINRARPRTGDPHSFELELQDDRGRVQHATVIVEGEELVVTMKDGPLRGTARLRR